MTFISLSPNLSSLSLNKNPVIIYPENLDQVNLEFLNPCIKNSHVIILTHLSLGANATEILELANLHIYHICSY